jgi:hypothetical protein
VLLRRSLEYTTILKARGKSPAFGSKSTNYAQSQISPPLTIYDGRCAEGNLSTVGPPIHIFHPVFNHFTHLVESPNIPTDGELKSVLRLMRFASGIYADEVTYNYRLRRYLGDILGVEIPEETLPDGARPDGLISVALGGHSFPYVFIELKREIGEGGCDPTTQVGLSMRRSWIHISVGYNCIIHLRLMCDS